MTTGLPLTLSASDRARLDEVERLAASGPRGVAPLLERLSDPSWGVRRAVVAALGALGEAAVPGLIEVLRNRGSDEARLAAAVDALCASVADCDEELLALSRDDEPAVVADALQVLGRRRSSAVARIIELVEHPNDNVAVAAIEALGRTGGPGAVEALLRQIEGNNFFRAFPAIDVIGRIGDLRVVEPLSKLLASPLYAHEAMRALAKTAVQSAVAPLASLLAGGAHVTVRLAAAALAELRARHAERFGTTTAVDEALRAVGSEAMVRRLCQTVTGADPAEQVAICSVLGALRDESAVPTLAALLDAPPPVTGAAAEALRAFGRVSQRELVAALHDGDSGRRRVLLPFVTRAGAAGEVVRCLSDPDPDVRSVACDALARLGDTAQVRTLFPLLADDSPQVAHAAVSAIQALGGAEAEVLARRASEAASPAVRRAAIRILGYFGYPSGLEALLRALDDPDEQVRYAALQGLPFLEDARALSALLAASRHESAGTRGVAMRALGQCASDLRVWPALLLGLDDADPWVRYYAAQSLGRLGCEPAAERIAALLGDPAGQVQVAAVEALSHLSSETAFNALREAVTRSPDRDVHRAALIGLGISGRAEALDVLLDATTDSDVPTRLVALSALAGFQQPAAVDALGRAAMDEDESVRAAATGFLAGQPTVYATELLIDLLKTSPSAERVVEALSVHSDARVHGILAALETADDELAQQLTSALARMHHRAAKLALVSAMSTANVAARKAAALSLAASRDPQGLEALERSAVSDPDPEVRRVCSLLLAR